MWLNNSMADKFTRFLSGVGEGILNPKGNLGDARHASRAFVDGAMARAPRTKFLYHVHFDINNEAMRNEEWRKKHGGEISILVKNATLPRFEFDSDVKNQYNRKKIIYKNINYNPVQIKFHDDSVGIVNSLWALYWGYYSAERSLTASAWDQTKNREAGTGPYNNYNVIDSQSFRYGLDQAGVEKPFFNSITIYTLSRRRFNSYKLINPYIRTWDHGNVDYAESAGTMESTMDIGYETVLYGAGAINNSDQVEPKGFQPSHYDQVPSPLSVLGGAQSSLFGPGGVFAQGEAGELANAKTIFGDNYKESVGTVSGLSATIGAINTFRSLSNINSETLKTEALNLALTPNRVANNTSGVPGVTFFNRKK